MEEDIFPEAHIQALYACLYRNWFCPCLFFFLKNFSHYRIYDALVTTFTSFWQCLIYSQSLGFQNISYSFLQSLQIGYPLSGMPFPTSLYRNLRNIQISTYCLPPSDRSSSTALSNSYLSPFFSIPAPFYYPMTLIHVCYYSFFLNLSCIFLHVPPACFTPCLVQSNT